MPREIDPENIETEALSTLANFDGSNVLEIGCGEGRLCERLASHAELVVGLDLGPVSLATAKRNNPELHYIAASGTHIPLVGGYFDIALFGWSL